MLANGLGRMIWWTPPAKRPMFFKRSTHFADKSFDGKGVLPVPGLIWHTNGKDLFLYAFKGEGRPQKDTRLFQAPFFNVWSNGQVCQGSATVPQGDGVGNPELWEAVVFGSYFTHPNFTQKNRLILKEAPHQFWQRMLKECPSRFPENQLVSVDLCVESLLNTDYRTLLPGRNAQGEF